MPKQQPPEIKVKNDLDALSQLFEANQRVEAATRAYDEAKAEKKLAEEYRETLMSDLDAYTIYRREAVAREGSMVEMFQEMPPWMKAKDLDKPEDPPPAAE